VKRIASDTWLDRRCFGLLRALGWLDQMLARGQDHFETAAFILSHHLHATTRRRPGELNWPEMLRKALTRTNLFGDAVPEDEQTWASGRKGGEQRFLATLRDAEEWKNLELLLRMLRELHVQPLLLSMPINGQYFDHIGVSSAARQAYYERLREMAGRYETPLVDFREHDEDPRFLVDHHDHLSAAGWMYYDEVLDAFFHDRLPLLAAWTPPRR
jgi:poly-D-alanine transfer protein DltD